MKNFSIYILIINICIGIYSCNNKSENKNIIKSDSSLIQTSTIKRDIDTNLSIMDIYYFHKSIEKKKYITCNNCKTTTEYLNAILNNLSLKVENILVLDKIYEIKLLENNLKIDKIYFTQINNKYITFSFFFKDKSFKKNGFYILDIENNKYYFFSCLQPYLEINAYHSGVGSISIVDKKLNSTTTFEFFNSYLLYVLNFEGNNTVLSGINDSNIIVYNVKLSNFDELINKLTYIKRIPLNYFKINYNRNAKTYLWYFDHSTRSLSNID